MSRTYRTTTREAHSEAIAYYALCDRARQLGLPVSLDDPSAPRTVRGLRKSVRRMERSR